MYKEIRKEYTIIIEEKDDKPNEAWDEVQKLVQERQLLSHEVTVTPALFGYRKGLKRYQLPNVSKPVKPRSWS